MLRWQQGNATHDDERYCCSPAYEFNGGLGQLSTGRRVSTHSIRVVIVSSDGLSKEAPNPTAGSQVLGSLSGSPLCNHGIMETTMESSLRMDEIVHFIRTSFGDLGPNLGAKCTHTRVGLLENIRERIPYSSGLDSEPKANCSIDMFVENVLNGIRNFIESYSGHEDTPRRDASLPDKRTFKNTCLTMRKPAIRRMAAAGALQDPAFMEHCCLPSGASRRVYVRLLRPCNFYSTHMLYFVSYCRFCVYNRIKASPAAWADLGIFLSDVVTQELKKQGFAGQAFASSKRGTYRFISKDSELCVHPNVIVAVEIHSRCNIYSRKTYYKYRSQGENFLDGITGV
ncbi:hypothetical protein ACJJTC_009344 [Scirpophaga incertulas]